MRNVRITKESKGIDAAHRVPNHESKCFNLHGHRYVFKVLAEGMIVDDPESPDHGMLVDFGILGRWLNEIHILMDHSLVLSKDDPIYEALRLTASANGLALWGVDWVPTAENFAKWAYEFLVAKSQVHFRPNHFRITGVECYETPTSVARYPAN